VASQDFRPLLQPLQPTSLILQFDAREAPPPPSFLRSGTPTNKKKSLSGSFLGPWCFESFFPNSPFLSVDVPAIPGPIFLTSSSDCLSSSLDCGRTVFPLGHDPLPLSFILPPINLREIRDLPIPYRAEPPSSFGLGRNARFPSLTPLLCPFQTFPSF